MSQHYSMEAPACILSSISLWSVGLEDGKGWWGQNGDIGRQQSLASRAHHLILHCTETEWTLSEMLYERLRIWTFLVPAEAATSAPSFCLPSHLSLYRGSCLPLTLSHSVVFVIHYFFLLKKKPLTDLFHPSSRMLFQVSMIHLPSFLDCHRARGWEFRTAWV